MAVTSHRNHSKHKQTIQQRMLVLQTFLQIFNHFRLDTEISVTNTLLHLRMSALLSSVECLLIGPASFLLFFSSLQKHQTHKLKLLCQAHKLYWLFLHPQARGQQLLLEETGHTHATNLFLSPMWCSIAQKCDYGVLHVSFTIKCLK